MPGIAVFVAVIVAALGLWLWLRRAPAKSPGISEHHGGKHFPAVEIRARAGACSAARALEGKRYLSNQAPALPLPGCTASSCTCTFAKLTDRRSEDRRFEHGGLSASLFLAKNRREKTDRRSG